MISIAALFRANNMKYVDGQDCIKIESPYGSMNMPKDGFSDGYRFMEAVAAKCKGGRGMVDLPALKGDRLGESVALRWAFKEAWDSAGVPFLSANHHIWKGDFQTYGEDHLNEDDEFNSLDVSAAEYYYNVCLNNREVDAFLEMNPSFGTKKCEEDCMKRPHTHAIGARYRGAQLDHPTDFTNLPVTGFGSGGCAPPFHLHPVWRSIEKLNPESLTLGGAEEKEKIAEPEKREEIRGARPRTRDSSFSSNASASERGPKKVSRWEGAEALEKFMKDPKARWDDILSLFREPKSAKWASSSLVSNSHTEQKRVKKRWAGRLDDEIMPLLLQPGGIKIQEFLTAIWEADIRDDKIVACYFMRRLVEGQFNIKQSFDGYLWVDIMTNM